MNRWFTDWLDYWGDALWRTAATADTLRERANNMTAHEKAGMPPLLHFESEEIARGYDFDPPCNYRLLRVTRCGSDRLEEHVRRNAAPVIVVDPRAGHGPGIGGFKRDSEVGMALREGHPVYFVVFDPLPVPDQSLGAVIGALAKFIEIVHRRHPGHEPIVYGNCQGGWAMLLALAHCNRRAGLAVLNGSPLSYWAGQAGVNPMRLFGGLAGGVWLAHMTADIGNGTFDGAWLVENFENLRPEGVWQKYDTLWAQPEKEHDRFLEFERWWNGFYFLGREEIVAIVRDLFIGNKIEDGQMVVDRGCRADLRRIKTPLVIFSSFGDNITPPHQALGWLRAVYESDDDLIGAGQRVVYLIDRTVGHLGIFVSADVAARQHRAILHYAPDIEQLEPGLYEMVLQEQGKAARPRARFERRTLGDIAFEPNPPGYEQVRSVSENLDAFYSRLVSPWVRLAANPQAAALLASVHPMRLSRQLWSERVSPLMQAAPAMRTLAKSLALDPQQRDANPWFAAERVLCGMVHEALAGWREVRDQTAELAFDQLYGVDVLSANAKSSSASCCEGAPAMHQHGRRCGG